MKLAVHLHLYYLEQLPEILRYLQSLDGLDYDLFVTMVEENKEVTAQIKDSQPKAQIILTPNYGYDVGPFIALLHQIDLDKYAYVLKIHTKGNVSRNHTWINGHRLDNRLWKQILFDALLKNKERVQEDLALLESKPQIGMISSKYCVSTERWTYRDMLPQINKVLTECGLSQTQKMSFVAGTMFYVRAKLLKPLLRYTINDFAPSDGDIKEGTFAHVMERLMGALVQAQGYTVYGLRHDNYAKGFFMAALKHFLFQKKKTNTGHTIIKLFRIPICHRKG